MKAIFSPTAEEIQQRITERGGAPWAPFDGHPHDFVPYPLGLDFMFPNGRFQWCRWCWCAEDFFQETPKQKLGPVS